ncbi:restriction endonuclease subunit S [Vibrio spartinae]|uniref:EcoKI restriction-modification system protein HsdS n=1 Tax=Vibrio spartinae TaxID=1918945 RepID=A0A1N6M8H8_9VIBR|nr:restriction endonuclease subunit S [Vibrio spartinae]SIO95758.1 EcoKI restriction-modification system protein HsdS [Vibrio spartinae]
MSQSKQSVPELRFPGFIQNWKEFSIRKITTKVGSGVTPKGGAAVYKQCGVALIRSQNVNNNRLDLSDVVYISEQEHESMKGSKVYGGDILLNITGASIGRSCVVPIENEEANINQHVCIIRLKERFSAEYLQAYLASWRGQKLIFQNQSGSGREGLNFESIKSFQIYFPDNPKEQQKIATFLSAIDQKITKLRQKRELLENYKTGVMQQIFSQQIRFKKDDGSDFPDWEEKRLKEIASPIKRVAQLREYPVLTISAGKGFLEQEERFSQVIAGSSLEKYTLIQKDEFAYNRGASKRYPYGCIYKMEDYEEALIPFVYRAFVLDEGVTDFYSQYFSFGSLNWQLRKMISSSARMDGLLNIGAQEFFNVRVPVPSLEEQQKIASFLQSIDQKITRLTTQIEQVQTFKQGLLQKMFV